MFSESNFILIEFIFSQIFFPTSFDGLLFLTEVEQRAQMEAIENQLENCRTELLTLRGRYSVLAEQHERLQEGSDRLIPLSVHTAAVNECKR